ncbi:MAG: GMC family oxidoreductase N-terminal domain-containing protein [Betaproteobacteria bacterium AqS2]|uniref:GMC family oxidoreductase N-terminal domain-containing protein n=1 Tax=Candidatus Amphirhobacter heronislandensis TaxID=1732024 RepID=A0A930UB75_9GAMM|nr:GMC family oxidoreductase N-terminal domain-containing protein [Betaproteobacteria bacterium AqS2]
MPKPTDTFDFVIVGTGTAGAVLVNRLSADGRFRVCALEAGGRDSNPFIHIPAGFMKTMTSPSVNWLYEAEPGPGTAGRRIAHPRGKTFGGSSSINGHIYNRGQRADFDHWAQCGNRGWGYADVLPYFRRSEGRIGDGDDRFRGREGEFKVEDLHWGNPLCDAFIAGAESLGIPRNPDYNGAKQEGVGYFQRSVHRARRMSAARAHLRPAMRRPNVEVRPHAHASRIVFDGGCACGVEYLRDGERYEVRATREVIIAGGAVNSPQLLQISGIGPPSLLNDLQVPVYLALPGVGENLRDHYAVRTAFKVQGTRTINELARGWRLGLEIAKYFLAGKGILTLQPTLVGCFWKSDDALENGDLQLTFTPASYRQGVQSTLESEPGATIAVWQQRPQSSGFVRARTPNPLDKPLIQPNYLTAEYDRQVIVKGVRLAKRLMRTAALRPWFKHEALPGEEIERDDELLDFVFGIGTTAFHLMGSCRMGPASDPMAVVDDRLRVHGVEGLRVADASIMPMMPSANTNASTLMIAEKASDLILDRIPPESAAL